MFGRSDSFIRLRNNGKLHRAKSLDRSCIFYRTAFKRYAKLFANGLFDFTFVIYVISVAVLRDITFIFIFSSEELLLFHPSFGVFQHTHTHTSYLHSLINVAAHWPYFGHLLSISLVSSSRSGALRSTEIKAFRNNEVKVSAHSRISPLVRREEAPPEDKDSVAAERRKIKPEGRKEEVKGQARPLDPNHPRLSLQQPPMATFCPEHWLALPSCHPVLSFARERPHASAGA